LRFLSPYPSRTNMPTPKALAVKLMTAAAITH
jgi:hypothetical protein